MNAGQGNHSRLMYDTKVTTVDFQEWPKTPRLFKGMTVTEKIDGTNACVVIVPHPVDQTLYDDPNLVSLVHNADDLDAPELEVYKVYAQSRKRMIVPGKDNAGFAQWVEDNANNLVRTLGAGRHYGEWWGKGIQRNYGAETKTFSLFNTDKWGDLDPAHEEWGLSVVPELYRGAFDTDVVRTLADTVWVESNVAAPGWDGTGEGVCVFHHASRQVFKVTDEGDKPKGGPRDLDGNVVPLFRDVGAFSGELVAA